MAFDTTQPINQEQAWIEKYRAALDKNLAPPRRNPIQSFLQIIRRTWPAWRDRLLEKSSGTLRNDVSPVVPEPPKQPSTTAVAGAQRKQVRRTKSVQKSAGSRAGKKSKAS